MAENQIIDQIDQALAAKQPGAQKPADENAAGQTGDERTHDDPKQDSTDDAIELTAQEQSELIELVRRFKQKWFLQRRMIIKRVMKAFEFFKGNQFISFDPETFQWFDALESAFSGNDKNEDLNLYQFATNFYQMLGFGFVAALSSQVPKSQFLPENAEREKDMATAKAASKVYDIIQRQNNLKTLHKQGLLFLWMAGSYFRHTRFVVDADRAGSRQEPVFTPQPHVAMPARYVCFTCGATTPEDQLNRDRSCPNCGNFLGDESFFPQETIELPTITDYEEVANGMVTQTIYSPLNVDCDPRAKRLAQSAILNLDEEIDLASLRSSYPKFWKKLETAMGGTMSPDQQSERLARQIVMSDTGSRSNFLQDLNPTLSRTWIQPWAFNETLKKEDCDKFKQLFPKGCLLVNVGDLFLEARAAKLEDEWTHCGTVAEIFGLYPPAVGDSAIPVQERINDVANIVHEYMDRLSTGIVLGNVEMIGSKATNGKPLLPGVVNPVKLRKGQGTGTLKDAIVQIKAELDENIYQYQEKLAMIAQLLCGVPPQVYGGSGDPHIETKGGQAQQLATAMGKLSLFWDQSREENSRAAEVSVKCAAKNMNDDWVNVVTTETKEYRNEYIRLDQMQGNIHAYPETDQGFPMSWAEIKQFWMDMVEMSEKSPYAQAILDDPANQQAAATWTGVPGMVVPGEAMRIKVLRAIDKMMKEKPVEQAGPDGVTPILMPSVLPDKDYDTDQDSFAVLERTVRTWAQENAEQREETPPGWANVLLYFQTAAQFAEESKARQAVEMMKAQGPPKQLPPGAPAQGAQA